MSRWRRIPPVHSPVTVFGGTVGAGDEPGAPGPVGRLAALLTERFNADAAILCGSGTQALQLALTFAREATGRDGAALPAYTCFDLVSAAVGAGVRTTFYDLDPDELVPEPRTLAAALARRPAALVGVHHFGFPAVPAAVVEDAAAVGVWLIEDAAQAQGGREAGRPLGSTAPLSVLSFGRGKGWTGGAGGALLLRGEAAEAADTLRSYLAAPPGATGPLVKLAAQWLLGRPAIYALPASLPWLGLGETHYVPPSPAAAMPAAVARQVLRNEPAARAEAAIRRRNARALRERLAGRPDLRVPSDRGEPGYLRLPLRVPGRRATDILPDRAARLGVLPSYPRPLPSLPQARDRRLGSDPGPFPGAEALARELFTAPTHSFLRPRDLDAIAALLLKLVA